MQDGVYAVVEVAEYVEDEDAAAQSDLFIPLHLEVKGIDEVKAASQRLRDANFPNLDYTGFIEGDDITKGTVDVVVTDGFTGNVALKTAEGVGNKRQ